MQLRASRLATLTYNLTGTADDVTQTFTYNPAGGIVTQAMSNSAYEWSFGSNFTDNYASDELNQIVSAGGVNFTHDKQGNTTAAGSKTYDYDDDNRLTSASGGGLPTSTLEYDPAGRLKRYVVSGAAQRYQYAGDQLIADYNDAGASGRRYVPGAGVDETLIQYESSGGLSNKRWLVQDARGSLIAITGSTGSASFKNVYDPYGVPASTNAGRFGYTGQIWLSDIGLYHYKARAYNPETGRFMQPDPIGYAGGMNLYGYVGNDPINATDPSGLCGTGSKIPGDASGCKLAFGSPGAYGYEDYATRRDMERFNGGQDKSILCQIIECAPSTSCSFEVCTTVPPGGFPIDSGSGGGGVNWAFYVAAGAFQVSRGALTTAGALVVDDASVVGVADDVLIPPALMVAAAAAIVGGVATVVHNNSLRSQRPTSVYEIYLRPTNATLKYGITIASPVENRYSRAFFGLFDADIRVLATFPNRSQARAEEVRLCQAFIAANGHLPPLSIRC